MNCNTTHYRANSSSVPGDPTVEENLSGIFASNPIRATLPVITAPTTEARDRAGNTLRQELVVVACAGLKELNFAFDSSVVGPEARQGFVSLAALLRRHPGAPMTVFGHADPSGPVHYNHFLSERRARAIFAVLVRDVTVWERLFTNQEGAPGDKWGIPALQLMHDALERTDAPVNTPSARASLFAAYMDFLRGEPDTTPKFPTLTPNDFLGRGKQKATLQGCSQFNPQLLLAHDEQAELDADLSRKAERDAKNEPNRRVVIYLFKAGTVIDPAHWPCPAAIEGEANCIARQWSNGKERRSTLFVGQRRRFGRAVRPERRELALPNAALADELGQEETTFGCRFYHGVALHSPCERDLKLWAIQLLVDAPTALKPEGTATSNEKTPLANRRFVAVVGTSPDAPVVRGRTSENGMVALPLFDPNVSILLKVDAFDTLEPPKPPPTDPNDPPDPADPKPPTTDSDAFADEDQFVVLHLAAGALRPVRRRDATSQGFDPDFDDDSPPLTPEQRELAAMQRLYNLGVGSDDTGGAEFGNWRPDDRKRFIERFQRDTGLNPTGVIDDATAQALFTAHGS